MLSTLLLPPVELHWGEQQIQIGIAADKPLVEPLWRVNLEEFKIHQETLMGCAQWPILLSETGCCWDTGVLVSKRNQRGYLPNPNRKCLTTSFLPSIFLHFPFLALLWLSLSTLLENVACILTPSWEETSPSLERKTLGQDGNPVSLLEQGIPRMTGQSSSRTEHHTGTALQVLKFKGEGTSFKYPAIPQK